MNQLSSILVLIVLLPTLAKSQFSQDACPPNIGFESGSFDKWSCSVGKIEINGAINVVGTDPTQGRHTILKNAPPFAKDPYGEFSVNCPNGSGYSIQLGNSGTGAQAERVSYTFKIPENENDFIIIYNYAVVFQNPNHLEFEQPSFSTEVFDETTGGNIGCASFKFVASGNLPGFQKSKFGSDVFYKNWSPVTIKLYGYAGKTIRLEFTTNDCTKGGHFGYAYVDVNENCSSLISGNVFCNGAKDVTLTSPSGFMEYHWFNSDFTQEIGNLNTLTLSPPPVPGTTYALQIVPFPGLGCLDTLYTTIVHSPESFTFNVLDNASACPVSGIDLTKSYITAGSSPGLKFSYFMDANQNEYIPQPKFVDQTGKYYIKAVNNVGCNEIKPITVTIKDTPILAVTNPPPLCYPNSVDLTNKAWVAGSEPGFQYSYFYTKDTLQPILQPTNVSVSGVYFIKGEDQSGCVNIQPVTVTVGDFEVGEVKICNAADLTANGFLKLETADFDYTFWNDAAATSPVNKPTQVTVSNTYYVKGSIQSGCSIIKPLPVTIYPLPQVSFTNPGVVRYPKTVDLTAAVSGASGTQYQYWKDANFSEPLSRPNSVEASGVYYITAKNSYGCSVNFKADVTVEPPPLPKVNAPNVFSPNGDGVNDEFILDIEGAVEVKQFRIYNRWSELVFTTRDITNFWNGKRNGKSLTQGTYYWVLDINDIYRKKSSSITGHIVLLR